MVYPNRQPVIMQLKFILNEIKREDVNHLYLNGDI